MVEQLALVFTSQKKPALPAGFRVSRVIPGCIEPTWGKHEGVPMVMASALVVMLAEGFGR